MTPAARAQIQSTIDQLQALLDADCDCPEANPVTVEELVDLYFATLPDAHWVDSNRSGLIRLMKRIGDVEVTALKPSHWEAYRSDPEIVEHYSVMSRNHSRKIMRACFSWAVETERIRKNPWQSVKPEKRKPKRQTEISFDGEAAIVERCDDTMKALVIVALDSGMRRDEIRLLEWLDVDWSTRKITIPATRTKTRRARVGRITTRAADALMAIPPIAGCPYVFANPETKEPWSKSWVWTRWREAADGAGIKAAPGDGAVRLHDARRTSARRLSRLGAPIAAIQRHLGHESLAVTAEYVDANEADVDAAHALLEAHLLLVQHDRKGPQRAPGQPRENVGSVRHAQAG